MGQNIRLAIQKSGRLSEESLKLIRDCGIQVPASNGTLKAVSPNFPIEVLFLRDDDIPGYVEEGVADLGIAGGNVVEEKGRNITTIHKLGFSKCRLSLAVPKEFAYQSLQDLNGMDIATSYPRILSGFLQNNGLACNIHEISGSVEIAPGIGLAGAICDIVSSGSTLLTNGLKEVAVVYHSEAVLVGSPQTSPEKQQLIDKLWFRIKSLQQAKNYKYILLNAPETALPRIKELLPGMRSPTVMPLATTGWVSVHSVIRENDFWEQIENIRAAGAEGILVIPIEKMIL